VSGPKQQSRRDDFPAPVVRFGSKTIESNDRAVWECREEKLIAKSSAPFFMTNDVGLPCVDILFDHTMLH
jgi:hypothetical protein